MTEDTEFLARKKPISARQEVHFERVHDLYEAHYYDRWSMAYREEFIYGPMFHDLDLNGLKVADLACGSGHTSVVMKRRFPNMQLTGFDISPRACDAYRELIESPCYQMDLTQPQSFPTKFDFAVIIGGLHHCVADLPTTLSNIAAMLKPDGRLLMLEPNSRHFLEPLRRLWYRVDKSTFDCETEHALDADKMLALTDGKFECERVLYLGGPAFFAVLNSMVLRIPLRVKPYISPPLMTVERFWNRMPGRRWHNVFLAEWRRL